jgi:Hemerythrin HHE cation binding domain
VISRNRLPGEQGRLPMKFDSPAALKLDHEDTRAALARAAEAPGQTGRAAQAVAELVYAHFAKEEEFVFPAFALMHDLSRGQVRAEMADILPLISRLEAEHDVLLAEHKAIHVALEAMMETAHRENNVECAQVAYNLMVHHKVEETAIYPTVLLIGHYIREKLDIADEA